MNVLIYIQTEIITWITLKSFKSLCLKSSPKSLTSKSESSLKSFIFFQVKSQVINTATWVDSSPSHSHSDSSPHLCCIPPTYQYNCRHQSHSQNNHSCIYGRQAQHGMNNLFCTAYLMSREHRSQSFDDDVQTRDGVDDPGVPLSRKPESLPLQEELEQGWMGATIINNIITTWDAGRPPSKSDTLWEWCCTQIDELSNFTAKLATSAHSIKKCLMWIKNSLKLSWELRLEFCSNLFCFLLKNVIKDFPCAKYCHVCQLLFLFGSDNLSAKPCVTAC